MGWGTGRGGTHKPLGLQLSSEHGLTGVHLLRSAAPNWWETALRRHLQLSPFVLTTLGNLVSGPLGTPSPRPPPRSGMSPRSSVSGNVALGAANEGCRMEDLRLWGRCAVGDELRPPERGTGCDHWLNASLCQALSPHSCRVSEGLLGPSTNGEREAQSRATCMSNLIGPRFKFCLAHAEC